MANRFIGVRMAKKLYTYREMADYLGVTVEALKGQVKRGQIPYVKLSQKVVRFDLDVIDAFINSHSVIPKSR